MGRGAPTGGVAIVAGALDGRLCCAAVVGLNGLLEKGAPVRGVPIFWIILFPIN